jgi:hypothetical protein
VPDIYGLTPQEVMVLRSALAKLDKTAPQAPKSMGLGAGFVSRPDDMPSPEVYVARTRSGGIPALSIGSDTGTGTGSELADDVPGSAICDIYSTQETSPGNFSLHHIYGLSKRVFNLSGTAIDGHEWIIVHKTKGGYWYVEHREVSSQSSVTISRSKQNATTFAITADNTWQDVGAVVPDIVLPSAGTYLIYMNASGRARCSAAPDGGLIAVRLYSETNGDIVLGESLVTATQVVNVTNYGSAAGSIIFTRNAALTPDTIRMEAYRQAGPTWTTAGLYSGPSGGLYEGIAMGFAKLA